MFVTGFFLIQLIFSIAFADYAIVTKRDGLNATLVTNLDDNQICYLHMYGLRINARRAGSPYSYGYVPTKGMNCLKLVTTSDSGVVLATSEEFINATRYSDHSPVYNPSFNYCDVAQANIDHQKAQNNYCRQTSPFALRDHAG